MPRTACAESETPITGEPILVWQLPDGFRIVIVKPDIPDDCRADAVSILERQEFKPGITVLTDKAPAGQRRWFALAVDLAAA